jgi:hypothetical protein
MIAAIALKGLASKLAAEGLGLLGSAVLAKGKAAIEEKLGVDIEQSLGSEEGRIRLQQLQAEREDDLHAFVLAKRQQWFDAKKAELADVADSRSANARIQESGNSSWLAKNTGYVIDFIVIFAALAMSAAIMFTAIPEQNREQAFAVWGALMALCGTVLQWHRGSSRSSQSKDATIAALGGKQ